ncbi:MAG: methyltransferase domain-containing protein [Pirellulales bacterium]
MSRVRGILASIVRRSVTLTCMYLLLLDWRTGIRIRRGNIETESGARHRHGNIEKSVDYVDRVFRDYKDYGGVEEFYGRICEIGPGDNFGVALRFLGAGAAQVVAIDRFYPRRDAAYQSRLYGKLSEAHGLSNLFRGRYDEASLIGLKYLPGTPAESYFRPDNGSFDFIVSRAVLEHLQDPINSLTRMFDCLAPGGMMIHRDDLRDHGMFPYHHPLTFLTISEPIYRRMVSNSGKPNRVLANSYRKWLIGSGGEGSIRISRVVGEPNEITPRGWEEIEEKVRGSAIEMVCEIRPHLARPMRSIAEADLATSGIVIVVQKPRNSPSSRIPWDQK